MENQNESVSKSSHLRQQAEMQLKSTVPIPPISEADSQKLFHELQVHQIELEMQNEQHQESISASAIDNTERKKAEQELKDSEEKYRFMFANNPQPMWIFDLETLAFLEVNQAAVSHYGYSVDEFLTMTLKDIRPEEDIPKLLESVEASKFKYNQQGEFRHIKKNGEIIDVQIIWHYVTFNGRKARHVLINDVTERKQVEASLRKSNWRLASVIEGTHAGTWEWNVQTGEVVFNELWAQMIGYSLQELELHNIKTWEIHAHPDDLRKSHELLYKHFNGELPYYDFECRMRHKDGHWVWIHDRGRVTTRTDNGLPLLMFGTHTDITERVNAEQEISLKNEELSNLVAEKDKFISVLAHDLRSPFNSILGFTQMLDDDLPTMEFDQIKQIASVLRNSAFNAYSLLENLLEWSRMKRGNTSYNPETFKLRSKIEESLQSVMELATKKWIDVSINVPEDLQVLADQNMLSSIIRNLTTNAIKFTPKYGTVLISAKVHDDQNIEISIKDTGIGMNQNILNKLFSHDEDNNRKGTEGESSSGLGLIICKEFIEKHGGRIWAESTDGKGSTFYFTLPVK